MEYLFQHQNLHVLEMSETLLAVVTFPSIVVSKMQTSLSNTENCYQSLNLYHSINALNFSFFLLTVVLYINLR